MFGSWVVVVWCGVLLLGVACCCSCCLCFLCYSLSVAVVVCGCCVSLVIDVCMLFVWLLFKYNVSDVVVCGVIVCSWFVVDCSALLFVVCCQLAR